MTTAMRDFAKLADELSPDEFEAKHSPGLLIQLSDVSSGKRPVTSVDFRERVTIALAGPSKAQTQLLDALVYDLALFRDKRAIKIGRGLDVDLFLSEPSVSRLHAILTWSPSGRVYLQHAGASSQTLIDDREAPSQMEAAVEVESGMKIALGALDLTFLSPREFQRILWRLILAEARATS